MRTTFSPKPNLTLENKKFDCGHWSKSKQKSLPTKTRDISIFTHDSSSNEEHKIMSSFYYDALSLLSSLSSYTSSLFINMEVFLLWYCRMEYSLYLFRCNVSVAICGVHKKDDIKIQFNEESSSFYLLAAKKTETQRDREKRNVVGNGWHTYPLQSAVGIEGTVL